MSTLTRIPAEATHPFVTPRLARHLRAEFGSPLFIYDARFIKQRALETLAFPAPFGLTVRYAMKACPTAAILRRLDRLGLHFDASSGWEVRRLLRLGIDPGKISLSSQELPEDFAELVQLGLHVNLCSLQQLERFGQAFPGSRVGLRFNPGLGSGSTEKTNTGGTSSSFGIWHEWMDRVREMVQRHRLCIHRIHTHIGSGSDPAVWEGVSRLTLALAGEFPEVTHVNLGGGFKVGRMPQEASTSLESVGATVRAEFERFAADTGRQLRLEIEPGTYLVANGGALLATVQDRADTGPGGHRFLKLDVGMTEILRPSLYGSQHPFYAVTAGETGTGAGLEPVVVVGHCCESGDLLSCAPEDPARLREVALPPLEIGDLVVIGGTGAYCAAMSAKNYNSFPEAAEVLIDESGEARLIRRRQSLEQIVANEIDEA